MNMNNIMFCVLVLFIAWKIIKTIIKPYRSMGDNIYLKPSPKMVYIVYLYSAIMIFTASVLLFLLPYRMFWISLMLILLSLLKWEFIYLFLKIKLIFQKIPENEDKGIGLFPKK
jgi:hypothetical protein